MSFKLKTVLLVLCASVIPFIVISLSFIYEIGSESREFAQKELKKRVEQTAKTIEHEIRLIQNDLSATAQTELMADIVTFDLDRRIFEHLSAKKSAFSISGDYFVLDADKNVVVSTGEKIKIGSKPDVSDMFCAQISSGLREANDGVLCLDYRLENLDKFLYSNAFQRTFVAPSENIPKSSESKFVLSSHIGALPKYSVVGELGDDGAVEKAKNALLLYFIVGFLIISAIAYLFASKISKPILKLSEEVDEIAANGEYSKRIKIDSDDELSKVSKAFNNLLSGMEEALQNRLSLAKEQSKSQTLEEMAKKLSRYISPQLVDSILSGEQAAIIESKRKKITVFFSDIVGFTSTTDMMEAEELSNLLNRYLNEMSVIALKHGATIDKFIGDAIMLFFGDPYSKGDKEDALSCLKMAIEMRQKLDELAQLWRSMGISKPFQARFGIHTGYCTVGNFGNEERMEYTIIGGTVNLASRIESSAKPNQILISEETYLLVRNDIECVFAQKIKPKGLESEVAVYEALYVKDSIDKVIEERANGLELKIDLTKIQNFEELQKKLIDTAQTLQKIQNQKSKDKKDELI